MEVWARTEVGLVREHNEDSYLVLPDLPLLAVADGMGGHQAGEVASRLAVYTLESYAGLLSGASDPAPLLEQAFKEANRQIRRQGELNPNQYGMGTTLTAALLNGRRLVAAHVGDSRLYLWRSRRLRRLTRDHSVVEELLQNGAISPQAALNHPFRHVLTRALGSEENVAVDCFEEELAPGDCLLLCSDGLTNLVADGEIELIMSSRSLGLPAMVDQLVNLALSRGGHDNVTVIIARLGRRGESSAG